MKRVIAAGLIVCVASAGCGPSTEDVIAKYRDRYNERQEQLKQFAGKLPARGRVRKPSMKKPLDPPLVLKPKSDDSNTECLMAQELTDPQAKPKFNVKLNSNLHTASFWMTQTMHGPGNPEHMEQTLERALNARYILVHRVAQITLPEARGPNKFTPGRAVIENFLFDVESGELIGQFTVSAQTSDRVRYSGKSTDSKEERLAAFAKSSMWGDARKKIVAALKDLTGGTVELE